MIRALPAAVLPAAALLATTLAFTGLALPAHARDARLVERLYDPTQVVRIDGRVNVQATIQFGEGESIENVAIGDSQKWQVTPNRRANLLFVKPLAERAATNMTVVTNKHTYLFDLVAGPQVRTPLYVLAFTYPKELEPAPEEDTQIAAVDGPNAVEVAAATDPYAVTDPARLNFAWTTRGDSKLLPQRVYDDGDATFLSWPASAVLPAILVKNAEGVEGPVNFAVRGDTIVVDGVPREIVLRAGEDLATLINNGPPRQAAAPRDAALAANNARSGGN